MHQVRHIDVLIARGSMRHTSSNNIVFKFLFWLQIANVPVRNVSIVLLAKRTYFHVNVYVSHIQKLTTSN